MKQNPYGCVAQRNFTRKHLITSWSYLHTHISPQRVRWNLGVYESQNKEQCEAGVISADFDGELFPRYLSFVKGVVDSDDLPLNVCREILQEGQIVRIMRKRLVRKTFDMIQELSESEKEDYKKFWENFGRFLKLGCIEDSSNHMHSAPAIPHFEKRG
ncbi:HEAT SHOCK PROTEIN 89.1 [Euphorbia peplus]|nr:HEAT SHOCK PROTEIN 89.1 [Euphorbia peplus]